MEYLADFLAANTITELEESDEDDLFRSFVDLRSDEGTEEGDKGPEEGCEEPEEGGEGPEEVAVRQETQDTEEVWTENQDPDHDKKVAEEKRLKLKSKALWNRIDIFAPIAVALFTFIPSLYLFIQAGSYTKPMFSLWVLVSITTGEALGVVFELVRWQRKLRFVARWDRVVNYLFSSLVALVYGIVLRQSSIYWTRRWITTLLPMAGGLFKYSRGAKWPKVWMNFFGTSMLFIEVYRITLIGAVWEFSGYALGLVFILLPLLYVEMQWVSALCPFWLEFQRSVLSKIASILGQEFA